ncbi:MAG TPA: hypothetical protein VFL86_25025 [Burkholderiaceae bacterium]|nr:hypothetical protein [Burkholderiaceae bacterium]
MKPPGRCVYGGVLLPARPTRADLRDVPVLRRGSFGLKAAGKD